MFRSLISPIAGMVVTVTGASAIEGLVKHLTPVGLKTIPAFGVKIGGALIAGLIAGQLSVIASKSIDSVISTVSNIPNEELETSEEKE